MPDDDDEEEEEDPGKDDDDNVVVASAPEAAFADPLAATSRAKLSKTPIAESIASRCVFPDV